MFYVYQHIRPDTNAVFYVGKGKGKRCFEKRRRNEYWSRIVNKANGFRAEIVAEQLDEELAFLIEQECIFSLKEKGFELANMTDGGEGSSGYRHTEKTKQMLSSQMKKTMDKYKHILSKKQQGENNSAKKKGVGDKISAALRGRKLSAERRAKSSRPRGMNPKAIKVSFNDKEFDCIKDMAEFIGMPYTTLVGRMRRMNKYHWTTEDLTPLQEAINGNQ